MNGNQRPHPTRDTLAAYGLGKLQSAEAVAVESHIAECEECCETLSDLGNDTFIDLVRRSEALQVESIADATIGLDGPESETIDNLPHELTEHPRYHVHELLGKGGMGNVYKAEHTLMNRSVALKVINHKLVQSSQAVDRFRREVQSAAQLSHPNIVTAYDAEQAGDAHYLVMEYVPGDTLSDVVKRHGRLDVAQACDYILQAAAGLQHAHEKGMVHRDVKPHNLMITSEGEIKILDFGLATLSAEVVSDEDRKPASTHGPRGASPSDLTSAGSMMGTPDFVSPEQAGDARSADIRSDIYSLGCTFYYLLTGRPPFSEGSAMERVKAHCESEPEPIEQLRPGIPPEVGDIVRRMMSKNPAQRFQTPAEIVDALAPFVEHPVSPARRGTENRPGATAPQRFWRPPMNILTVASAAIAIVLAGIIYLATDNGTLVVESDDEAVQVIILPGAGEDSQAAAAQLRIVDTITGSDARRLRSGEYVLNLKGDQNDFELSQERFILKRGGKIVVKVMRKPIGDAQERLVLRERWAGPELSDYAVLSISQDGRYCTFVDDGYLALRDLTTGKEKRLTQETLGPRRPPNGGANGLISPNNEWVAYLGGNLWSGFDLRVVRSDGTGEQRVFQPFQFERPLIQLWGWTRDSGRVLVTVRDRTRRLGEISLVSVQDGSTKTVKTLTEGEGGDPDPRISPDGQFIAYEKLASAVSSAEDIFLLRLDDGKEIPLIEHPAADNDVIGWTPDGKSFLFRSDRLGAGVDAWAVPFGDGNVRGQPYLVKKDIPRHLDLGTFRTSRDTTAFYSYTSSPLRGPTASDVFIAELDPITGRVQAPPRRVSEHRGTFSPAWSPDGKYLAYNRLSEEGERSSLVIRTLATGQERELPISIPAGRDQHAPEAIMRWSPDGRSILRLERRESSHGIYLVDVESGTSSPIVEKPRRGSYFGDALWSPDGKTILYTWTDWNARQGGVDYIVARDLESGKERVLYGGKDSDWIGDRIALSPDGRQLVFGAPRKNGKGVIALKVIPTAGGAPRELYREQEDLITSGMNIRSRLGREWTPDGRFVIFEKDNFVESELWRLAVQGGEPGEPQKIGLKLGPYPEIRIHPDGRQIAFTNRGPFSGIRVVELLTSSELVKQSCIADLKSIGNAIREYRREHGELPNWLSDLHASHHLHDHNLLLCPADSTDGLSLHQAEVDPELPCSYHYNPTRKDAKELELKYFGGMTPIVQCRHHGSPLALTYDGDANELAEPWQTSPQALTALLSRLKRAVQENPTGGVDQFGLAECAAVLSQSARVGQLRKLLEQHLHEHPELQSAGVERLLAALEPWSEIAKGVATDTEDGDALGDRVAIDGDTIVVTAPRDKLSGDGEGLFELSGSAYVFVRRGDQLVQQTKLIAEDASRVDKFGSSVAISGDTIVLGAELADAPEINSGAVYVFGRRGTQWLQQAELIASDGAAGAEFGDSVAIDGDTIAVGADEAAGNVLDSGAAYVFRRDGTRWTQEAKLTAEDGQENDEFGQSIAISGDTVVVGAQRADAPEKDTGAAYVFQRNGTSWSQQAKLFIDDADAGDELGDDCQVAISGDTVVVAAEDADDHRGAAYVFQRSGNTWSLVAKLTAIDAAVQDTFGESVAIEGHTIVVGADGADGAEPNTGAAYVFQRVSGRWIQTAKIWAKDRNAGDDEFGQSVAINGASIVVGSGRAPFEGADSFYLFSRTDEP